MIKSRRMRWERYVAHMVGKPEGKRPLERVRHKWKENVKLYLGLVWTGIIKLRSGTGGVVL
jgi:hypothetical protein